MLDLLPQRLGPHLEHGREDLALLSGVYQALAVGFVHGDRLLGEDMESLAEGVYADRRVEVVGCGDDDGVHEARADELLALGELHDVLPLCELALVNVANRRQLGSFDLVGLEVSPMMAPHPPDSDDPDSYFIHVCLPRKLW